MITRFSGILLVVFVLMAASPLLAEEPVVSDAPVAGERVTDEAQRIYRLYGDALYQVQVIDLASDKKSGIGSGFQFTADGFLATNYHVVAEAIQRPEKNRLEYLHEDGGKGSLKVLMADVVHDLAILQMDTAGKTFVELGESKIPKGAKLFSMGNPHDIGFSVVEGINNGPSDESFIEKIHFSGAINPGMSGGPALGHNGKVVGVNVMTGGNQIGFLVPVEYLRMLMIDYLSKPDGFDFAKQAAVIIEEQLDKSQESNLRTLMKEKWENIPFGPIEAPGRIHEAFKCWGAPRHEEKDPYEHYVSGCYSSDRIFLDDGLETGAYTYQYDRIIAKDNLLPVRFYTLYEDLYGSASGRNAYNASEADVTNFECNAHFIDYQGLRWKGSFCARQYKKYPRLFDAHFYMALTGMQKEGMTIALSAQGVTRKNALAFVKRFAESITPKGRNARPMEPVMQDKPAEVLP